MDDDDDDLFGPGTRDSLDGMGVGLVGTEDDSAGSTDSEDDLDGADGMSDERNQEDGTDALDDDLASSEDDVDDLEDIDVPEGRQHEAAPADMLDGVTDSMDDPDGPSDDPGDLDDPDDRLNDPGDGDGGSSGGQGSEDGGGSSGDEAPAQRVPTPPENSAELDQRAAGLPRELYQGYRLLREMMSPAHHPHNLPFMDPVDSSQKELWDYDSIVKDPIWLKKIRERLLSGEYDSLKGLFSDLRLMFRNCYRYNGPKHAVTRRALRLEQLMEQLIERMEPDLREQCTLQATEGPGAVVDAAIVNRRRSARAKKREYRVGYGFLSMPPALMSTDVYVCQGSCIDQTVSKLSYSNLPYI